MMERLTLALTFVVSALAAQGSASPSAYAEGATELRIATLAPTGSSWMKVFNAWNQTLQKESNNTLKLRFYAGGSQGDERDFIRKMRVGQMDGAAMTAVGLGQLVRPVLVLTLPGVIKTYAELDAVLDKMNEHFGEMFAEEGYQLLGWIDVGKARLFSTQKIERPSQIKKLRPWAWKDDPIFIEFLKIVGANGVRLGVPEVYPALQTHMVDTLQASALAAVSLQWYTRLNYVSASNSGILVGVTVVRKDKFDALTPEQQAVLTDTGFRAHRALIKAIRRDDERSYATMLKRGITPVDTQPYQAEWDEVQADVRVALTGRVYPKSLLQEVAQTATN